MLLLGYVLAALIGLSLGVIGGGGSILTVPILVYVMGFDAKLAIAINLPVVGGTSLVGALSHWKAGNVKLKMAALFGVIAMVGAFAGARLAIFLSGALQLVIAMNSVSGFAGYIGQVTIPWGFVLGFTGVAAAGILVGTRLVRYVSQAALKQGFAVFLLLMGTFIFYKNRHSLRPLSPAPAATAEVSLNQH